MKKDYDFDMHYNNKSSTTPVASFNGKQMEVNGNFGKLHFGITYDGETSEYTFEAHKFTFNFKNEHVFTECDDSDDTNDLPEPLGEMAIHHKTAEG
jgi:hypothetical protein